MIGTMIGTVQPHNERPAVVWGSGGNDYDQISKGIADSIEHCVMRLDPRPGERILDRSRIRSPGRGSSRMTQCSMESAIPLLIWS